MSISMEQIDELRKRTNCSYEEAKVLLEEHNGNVVDAIVELEKKHRVNDCSEKGSSFWTKLKALFNKGFRTRFVVLRKDETIVNLSINFMILVTLFAFHLLVIGLVLALILGYNFRIRKDKNSVINVDKIISDVKTKVKSTASSIVEDEEEKKTQKSDSDYNEVTVE